MPAMLDDPTAPIIYRTTGEMPYPTAGAPLPHDIIPRQVILRDRVTTATLLPFSAPDQVPVSLVAYLSDQLNREIEKGDTYPMVTPLPLESFAPYWFGVFGAVMLLGDIQNAAELMEMERQGRDWDKECLGSFYIKPNYPGRSSHVCNAGFIVTDGARNRGVGRLMGEGYLEWAPKLGYTYSVFNLVYETNVASCRIWDALGFKRIGRVKGAGNLKSYPDEPVDAIIYGRSLGGDDDFVSEERFDKIRFYLKYDKYPNGADRAEKSRLRSASLHYSLIPAEGDEPEKLMLKGKEVIPDPQKQYEIARAFHLDKHGGINKTTASIAEKYHWVRIKETVSQVIRHCPQCGEPSKVEPARPVSATIKRASTSRRKSSPSKPHSRSPSPSEQLQQEAQGADLPEIQQQLEAFNGSYQVPEMHYREDDMPVDPQLMNAAIEPPPSPFLAAAFSTPTASSPIPGSSQDTPMTGTGEVKPSMSHLTQQMAHTTTYSSQRRP